MVHLQIGLSMKSMKSCGNDDALSQMEEAQTFTKLALYKGTLVAVRMVNKLVINMSREDLLEIKTVSFSNFRTLKFDT